MEGENKDSLFNFPKEKKKKKSRIRLYFHVMIKTD